jgi:hypothetical protein
MEVTITDKAEKIFVESCQKLACGDSKLMRHIQQYFFLAKEFYKCAMIT